jgi:catechol 2,3-dioxygenase-like lactoylglutathione lyase family enzyme
MLNELHTVLPAANLERARTFYHDKLGIDPDEEHEGELIYHLQTGAAFELYETSNAGTAQNTQMGWVADDLDREMTELRDRGVVFEEYDVPGMKTENGVAAFGDSRAAWFRDTEGNFLCVSERV